MAALRVGLSKFRKVGGSILKFIGLVSVADTVSKTESKTSDWMTMGVIGLVFVLFLGGRR